VILESQDGSWNVMIWNKIKYCVIWCFALDVGGEGVQSWRSVREEAAASTTRVEGEEGEK
jgi:hypothetical protein